MRSIEQIVSALEKHHYITDRPLATVLFLAQALKKPVFLEGEPGVGKTEVALVLSRILKTRLIRLQCYEGLDVQTALYEWNYPKQILSIRLAEAAGRVTGRKPELRMEAARPGEILRSALDVTKAADVLGWRPAVTFDAGLAMLMDWFRTEG